LYNSIAYPLIGQLPARSCKGLGIKCVTVTHCMLRVLYVGRYAVTHFIPNRCKAYTMSRNASY